MSILREMSSCSLCSLPTPEEPVTADDVEGRFCCRGCSEVSATLEGRQPATTIVSRVPVRISVFPD
ncbi:hypothetical protein [Natrinema gelatinilyticum]|uniref:hypothetical protein n=1 Tax=Natrinema gelatinilyticum TaxID=2961571 RepID=UPI0020C27F24|nr:hypothetical protein [Natrinema gelatinilyticum]